MRSLCGGVDWVGVVSLRQQCCWVPRPCGVVCFVFCVPTGVLFARGSTDIVAGGSFSPLFDLCQQVVKARWHGSTFLLIVLPPFNKELVDAENALTRRLNHVVTAAFDSLC